MAKKLGKTQGVAVFQGGGAQFIIYKAIFCSRFNSYFPSECSRIPLYEYKFYFKAWSEFENDPNQQNMFR